MTRTPLLLAALLLTFASSWGSSHAQTPSQPPTGAQDPSTAEPAPSGTDVVVTLDPGQRPLIRLAFPEMARTGLRQEEIRNAATVLEETLRNDLERALLFEIQGPWAFTALTLTGERGRDFEQYRSLGNEIILEATVKEEGGRLTFEGRLSDLKGAATILGKRYRGQASQARRIAHTFADELVSYFTGKPGIALTRLAFVSDRDEAGRKEIYLMDYDGANAQRLTGHRSTSMSPAWNPGGSLVAYTSFFSGTPSVYHADVASGRKTSVARDGSFNTSPTFSNDGRYVAFARSVGGNIEIFRADRDGGNLRRLTNARAIDTNPVWSPTGTAIAFTSGRAGRPQIYAMDPDGANVRRLTLEGSYNDNAAWHPDGTTIAYTSRRGGRFRIAVTNTVTLETRVLTTGPGEQEDPTYSPDGRFIAFTWKRGQERQIYLVDAEGRTDPIPLTSVGNNEGPSWSPYPR